MLALLLAVGLWHSAPQTPAYQLRLDIFRRVDTLSTTFVVAEGVEGRALIEAPNSFTRVRVRVTKREADGCLHINLGAVTRSSLANVDRAAIEPIPTVQLCDASTARVSVGDGPLYQITVHEVTVPSTAVDTMPASVVQRFVDAANARDAKAMAALVTPDAVFASFPGGQTIAEGRQGVEALYARALPSLPKELQITVSPRIVEGHLVIDQEHFAGHPSGQTSATWMYLVRGGLITKAWALNGKPD
jgi:uncharacterized protein (TIGR02246 family)